MSAPTHCFVGIDPRCQHTNWCAVDDGRDDTRAAVLWALGSGLMVRRLLLSDVDAIDLCDCHQEET